MDVTQQAASKSVVEMRGARAGQPDPGQRRQQGAPGHSHPSWAGRYSTPDVPRGPSSSARWPPNSVICLRPSGSWSVCSSTPVRWPRLPVDKRASAQTDRAGRIQAVDSRASAQRSTPESTACASIAASSSAVSSSRCTAATLSSSCCDAARSDQCRGHPGIAQHPGQGQLGEALTTVGGDLLERLDPVQIGVDRGGVEGLALRGSGVRRHSLEIAVGQQALGQRS